MGPNSIVKAPPFVFFDEKRESGFTTSKGKAVVVFSKVLKIFSSPLYIESRLDESSSFSANSLIAMVKATRKNETIEKVNETALTTLFEMLMEDNTVEAIALASCANSVILKSFNVG